MQRVAAQQAIGLSDGGAKVVCSFQHITQARQRHQESPAQPLTLRHDPVIVAVRQQVPCIQRNCRIEMRMSGCQLVALGGAFGFCQIVLKLGYVQHKRGSRTPLHNSGIDVEKCFDIGDGATQR